MKRSLPARIGRFVIWVTLVCVVLGYWVRIGPGVNLVNYWRLHAGMSMEEVEALLGEEDLVSTQGLPIRIPNQGCIQHWVGYSGSATLVFDSSGRLVLKEWDPSIRKRTHLDRTMGRWIGVQEVRE